jgi:hypothetical protein
MKQKSSFYLLLLLILLIFNNCKINDKSNAKIYVVNLSKENEEFRYILTYFDNKVKRKCTFSDTWQCYKNFCKVLNENIEKKGKITIDTTGLNTVLSAPISKELFIKTNGKLKNNNGTWNDKNYYHLNLEGKFAKSLKKQAENDKFIRQFYNKLLALGTFGPGSMTMMTNCNDINFKDENIRLIYALYWIIFSLNYQ